MQSFERGGDVGWYINVLGLGRRGEERMYRREEIRGDRKVERSVHPCRASQALVRRRSSSSSMLRAYTQSPPVGRPCALHQSQVPKIIGWNSLMDPSELSILLQRSEPHEPRPLLPRYRLPRTLLLIYRDFLVRLAQRFGQCCSRGESLRRLGLGEVVHVNGAGGESVDDGVGPCEVRRPCTVRQIQQRSEEGGTYHNMQRASSILSSLPIPPS
jgi:hypothetical protein